MSLAARRLRILILRQGYYPDDPRVRREVEALAARGHAVDLVCLRGPGQPARETLAGARVYRLPLARRRAGRLRYLWDYLAFFVAASLAVGLLSARRRYPLVQVNSLPDFLVWAAWPARLTGARVLLDLHELMPELFASKYATGMDHPLPRLLGRIETAAIRWSDASLAVSQPCLERYLARGAPAERFTVILNSADPSLFPPPATAGDARAAGPQASPAPLRIVSHGTLVERYGYDLLLAALARLLDEGLDLRLEILGAGEQRPALEAQARALGLGEHLTLVGFVPLDRVAERLAGADIGAVANRSDPFTDRVLPTKLMEYAALGIPALAPATPAVRAYFDAGMVQLFEPGDLDALTAALRTLALDPALRARLADAAMTGFVARHGWPRMAERYTALVERLAGEGARPG